MAEMKLTLLPLVLLFGSLAASAGGFAGLDDRVPFDVCQTTAKAALRTVRTTPFTRERQGEHDVIDLDRATARQTFLGLGISFTDASCWLLSQMPAAERRALLEELLTEKGLGLSIGRLNEGSSDYATALYSYDDTDGDVAMRRFSVRRDEAYVIPVLKEALSVRPDLFFFSSTWSPPGWMKTSGRMCGGALRDDCLEALANYHVAYLKAYRDRGIVIRAMTNQNEPGTDQSGGCPATFVSAEQEATLVGRLLPPRLKAAGLDVALWLWDHNYTTQDVTRVLATLADPDVAKVTRAVAFHPYAGRPEEMRRVLAAHPDATLHLTEHGPVVNGGWNRTETYWLDEMIDCLANGCSSYSGWNLCLDADGQPCTGHFPCGGLVEVTPGVPGWRKSAQYAAFRQLGPYVKRGARVLETPPAAFPAVKYVAFRNPDGSLVLVLSHANEGLNRRVVQIKCRGEYLQLALPLDTWSLTTLVVPVQSDP